MLGQQSLGPLGCVELIILELDDGERAVVLDEFTHERGVGIERIAADQFAVEGAHGQGVHQGMRERFFVAGSTAGELCEGFTRGGIAQGDECRQAAVQGLAVDRQQRRQRPLTELPVDHHPGQIRGVDRREHLAPTALARRRDDARVLGGAAKTQSPPLGGSQFLHKAKQVADGACPAGQAEDRAGEHRGQRKLSARGTARVGHRAQRLGQTFGAAQRHGQLSEGARLFPR